MIPNKPAAQIAIACTDWLENMNDPQQEQPSALLRMAMRLYNSGYHSGHHDTVEDIFTDILSCDMENYHEEEACEILQDFLGSNLTNQDLKDFQVIFDDAPLPSFNNELSGEAAKQDQTKDN